MKPATYINVKVLRYDPNKQTDGRLQDFQIESEAALSVMALLSKVHEQDATFACRTSTCFKGKCGSCLVNVNGQDVLGCMTLVQPGEAVIVRPHSKFKVIRDVVVDFNQPDNVAQRSVDR